jgi:hypothetical protein
MANVEQLRFGRAELRLRKRGRTRSFEVRELGMGERIQIGEEIRCKQVAGWDTAPT